MSIEFHDNSVEIKEEINSAIIAGLHEAGGEIAGQAARNSPVDTGQLKGSWKYKVDDAKQEAHIGSNLENAIWNEFGTGQYALHGDGRKTPWKYMDRNGKWHKTTGKKPQRSFHFAFEELKPKIPKVFEEKLKGLGK